MLPECLLDEAIGKAHQGSHPGMTSMKRRLRIHFWCPRLNKRVQKMVQGCKECAIFTPKTRKNILIPHKLEDYNAWEKISVDLFGPMPDHRHIVVAQDMVSKFPAAKILKKTDANHVLQACTTSKQPTGPLWFIEPIMDHPLIQRSLQNLHLIEE